MFTLGALNQSVFVRTHFGAPLFRYGRYTREASLVCFCTCCFLICVIYLWTSNSSGRTQQLKRKKKKKKISGRILTLLWSNSIRLVDSPFFFYFREEGEGRSALSTKSNIVSLFFSRTFVYFLYYVRVPENKMKRTVDLQTPPPPFCVILGPREVSPCGRDQSVGTWSCLCLVQTAHT